MNDILNAKIKNEKIVNKFDISRIISKSDLDKKNRNISKLKELKSEQYKIVKLQIHGFENMFLYQPKFSIWTKALIMLIKIFAILNKDKNKILFVYFILYNKRNIYCFVFTFTDCYCL